MGEGTRRCGAVRCGAVRWGDIGEDGSSIHPPSPPRVHCQISYWIYRRIGWHVTCCGLGPPFLPRRGGRRRKARLRGRRRPPASAPRFPPHSPYARTTTLVRTVEYAYYSLVVFWRGPDRVIIYIYIYILSRSRIAHPSSVPPKTYTHIKDPSATTTKPPFPPTHTHTHTHIPRRPHDGRRRSSSSSSGRTTTTTTTTTGPPGPPPRRLLLGPPPPPPPPPPLLGHRPPGLCPLRSASSRGDALGPA